MTVSGHELGCGVFVVPTAANAQDMAEPAVLAEATSHALRVGSGPHIPHCTAFATQGRVPPSG